jgi:hypothetical protein
MVHSDEQLDSIKQDTVEGAVLEGFEEVQGLLRQRMAK